MKYTSFLLPLLAAVALSACASSPMDSTTKSHADEPPGTASHSGSTITPGDNAPARVTGNPSSMGSGMDNQPAGTTRPAQ